MYLNQGDAPPVVLTDLREGGVGGGAKEGGGA